MGWRISFESNKKITRQEIDEFLLSIPKELNHPLCNSKQTWGWALATDLNAPIENKISISGAYYSIDKAELMKNWLTAKLRDNGHTLIIDELY